MVIKISRMNQRLIYGLMIVSVFMLGTEIRYGINSKLYNMNILFFATLTLALYINRKNLSLIKLVLVLVLILQCTAVNILTNQINQDILSAIILLVPLFWLTIDYTKLKIDYLCLSKFILKTINFFTIIIFAIWLLDTFCNGFIMKIIAIYLTPNVLDWLPNNYFPFSYRYASYIGHYLATCEIYLMFLILNKCFYYKTNSWIINKYLVYLIGVLGILSTGSKTGLILLLLFLSYTATHEKHIVRNIIFLVVMLCIAQFSGAFDLVIGRFNDNTLSTGRIESWMAAYNAGVLKVQFLTGYGANINEFYAVYIGAFKAKIITEFPVASDFLRYGIFNTVLLVIIIYMCPLIELLKTKKYYFAFALTIFFFEINTFNWLSTTIDATIFYILFINSLCFINLISNGEGQVNNHITKRRLI